MPKKQKGGYRHLTQHDRDRIEAMLDRGERQNVIANILKVDAATISREIRKRKRRNGRYDAAAAQMKAGVKRSRSKWRGMKIEGNPTLKRHLVRMLRKKRSPDEIAGRMAKDKIPFRISKNAIYRSTLQYRVSTVTSTLQSSLFRLRLQSPSSRNAPPRV